MQQLLAAFVTAELVLIAYGIDFRFPAASRGWTGAETAGKEGMLSKLQVILMTQVLTEFKYLIPDKTSVPGGPRLCFD